MSFLNTNHGVLSRVNSRLHSVAFCCMHVRVKQHVTFLMSFMTPQKIGSCEANTLCRPLPCHDGTMNCITYSLTKRWVNKYVRQLINKKIS